MLASGKKQLNNLIGLLDKGGGVKETLTGAREPQALRTVKAKRDADDAGMSYVSLCFDILTSSPRSGLSQGRPLARNVALASDKDS